MEGKTYAIKTAGGEFIFGVFILGIPAMLFLHSATKDTNTLSIIIKLMMCLLLFSGTAFCFYRFYFDKSTIGFVTLTNDAISIPAKSCRQLVKIHYESIKKIESTSYFRGGQVINIWHKNGAIAIPENLLVDKGSYDQIFSELKSHAPDHVV
ncbi:hypothetical protein [Formivibrio citricus]|uniref:hypothetical protein n=1 Tax=Formivibrio citricus TaxID=83765 RepID=UPI000B829FB4|nr:hypothetical protein [Formivibrio citricus]